MPANRANCCRGEMWHLVAGGYQGGISHLPHPLIRIVMGTRSDRLQLSFNLMQLKTVVPSGKREHRPTHAHRLKTLTQTHSPTPLSQSFLQWNTMSVFLSSLVWIHTPHNPCSHTHTHTHTHTLAIFVFFSHTQTHIHRHSTTMRRGCVCAGLQLDFKGLVLIGDTKDCGWRLGTSFHQSMWGFFYLFFLQWKNFLVTWNCHLSDVVLVCQMSIKLSGYLKKNS